MPDTKWTQGGQYGLALTKEQTAVLESNPYADSVLRTADGRMVADTLHEKEPFLGLLLYPAEGNQRYKRYFEQIDFLMDQVGFNGIYIDQFSLGWGPLERWDRRTMDKWDGHTVDIDERTGQVLRKYTDCGAGRRECPGRSAQVHPSQRRQSGRQQLSVRPRNPEPAGLPLRRDGERLLRSVDLPEGKTARVLLPGQGTSGQPNHPRAAPGRWGQKGEEHWAEFITKAVIAGLRNGLLYYYYTGYIPESGPGAGDYGPVNHMFPFTPIELHSGWLLGQERIIACISGTYRWPHKEAPVCHRFDLKGREIPHDFQMNRRGDGWQVKVVVDDWNEVAVLEEPTVGP